MKKMLDVTRFILRGLANFTITNQYGIYLAPKISFEQLFNLLLADDKSILEKIYMIFEEIP